MNKEEIEKAFEVLRFVVAGAPVSNINAFDKDRLKNACSIVLAQASLVDTVIEKLKSDREAAKKEYQITLSDFQDGKRAEIDELLKILEVNENE